MNLPLKTIAMAAGLASATLLPQTVAAGELSLTGEGTVQYTPDSARLQFTASAEHAEPEQASRKVAEAMQQWREAIRPWRNDLEEYSDAAISLYSRPVPDRNNNESPETRAVASQTVSFSIRDLELLNPLIEKAQSIGLQYHLGAHQFFHSNEDELENQALAKAIEDARKRCAFAAERFGQTCGDVVSVSLDNSHRPMPMMRAQAAEASDPITSVGPREISATISATFELD